MNDYVSLPLFYAEAINALSDEDMGKLFRAILQYAKNNIEPDFDYNQILDICFAVFKIHIDRSLRNRRNRKSNSYGDSENV